MTEAIVPSARPSFDGRMDTMTQAIRIHELSADGCLVVGEDHSAIGHRIVCKSTWRRRVDRGGSGDGPPTTARRDRRDLREPE